VTTPPDALIVPADAAVAVRPSAVRERAIAAAVRRVFPVMGNLLVA
jgi:hypothetical protein